MTDPTTAVFIIVALLAGGVIGYFVGCRPVAEWRERHNERDNTAKELDEKFRKAIVDLENASVRAQRADELAAKLECRS